MSNIAYIRVSTEDQNTSRQEELFKDYKIDKFYKEKVSGKNIKDRPELQKMMDRKIIAGSAKSDQPA